MAADPSLGTLWRLAADPRGAAFTVEFTALARHRKTIRAEIVRYAERFRAAQLEALASVAATERIVEEGIPPTVVLLLMTGVTQILALEQDLGVTAGHQETIGFVEQAVARLDSST